MSKTKSELQIELSALKKQVEKDYKTISDLINQINGQNGLIELAAKQVKESTWLFRVNLVLLTLHFIGYFIYALSNAIVLAK